MLFIIVPCSCLLDFATRKVHCAACSFELSNPIKAMPHPLFLFGLRRFMCIVDADLEKKATAVRMYCIHYAAHPYSAIYLPASVPGRSCSAYMYHSPR